MGAYNKLLTTSYGKSDNHDVSSCLALYYAANKAIKNALNNIRLEARTDNNDAYRFAKW